MERKMRVTERGKEEEQKEEEEEEEKEGRSRLTFPVKGIPTFQDLRRNFPDDVARYPS